MRSSQIIVLKANDISSIKVYIDVFILYFCCDPSMSPIIKSKYVNYEILFKEMSDDLTSMTMQKSKVIFFFSLSQTSPILKKNKLTSIENTCIDAR